ncbi:MAG TPA: hypothetical protein EYH31_04530 [Anaerolineae bacterium]|nr:hypothetical protein [Anaerolineae bacterium]
MSRPLPTSGKDVQQHRRQTENRLILGGFAILVVVGGGLIWLIYGRGAALLGLTCIFAGLGLFGLLYLILKGIELWVGEE